jgi:acetolactate synthase I/II/III large subunit
MSEESRAAETGLAPAACSGGERIALALKRSGVTHLFTLNGGHIWPILTGAEEHGLRVVDFRHEQSAAFAAEGWSKVTRTCGVAAVTAGPGVTNAVTTLAAAHANDTPMLILGGRAPTSRWGEGALQELDHLPVVSSLVKSAHTLETADLAGRATSEAIRLALSGRTGPTFLDVPLEVCFGDAGPAPPEAAADPDRGPAPDPDQIAAVARLVSEAERPVLLAGGSVWWAHAEDELRQLAESSQVPVVLNGQARGMLPGGHPLLRSRARSAALGQADLVLVVGAELDFRYNFGRPPLVAATAKIAYVDVDGDRKHRPAAAAAYGDVRRCLGELVAALKRHPDRTRWLASLADVEAEARRRDQTYARSDAVPIHPARLIAEVEAHCDPDAILVGDGGDLVSFAGRLIERRQPGLWVDPGPFGCLGSGPGYAIAAKLARPDRQVVLVAGDGAFGFAAMEFDTMVRHRLPVVCVVGNNGIWALEKHPMKRMMGRAVATDLNMAARYDRVVADLGGHGELVERPEDIGPALRRAFASGVPACVNVILDPEARYPRSAPLA